MNNFQLSNWAVDSSGTFIIDKVSETIFISIDHIYNTKYAVLVEFGIYFNQFHMHELHKKQFESTLLAKIEVIKFLNKLDKLKVFI